MIIISMAGFLTALDNRIVTTAPSIREDLGGGLTRKRGSLPPA
ncbi:hypothetical protein [Streptomyces canus]